MLVYLILYTVVQECPCQPPRGNCEAYVPFCNCTASYTFLAPDGFSCLTNDEFLGKLDLKEDPTQFLVQALLGVLLELFSIRLLWRRFVACRKALGIHCIRKALVALTAKIILVVFQLALLLLRALSFLGIGVPRNPGCFAYDPMDGAGLLRPYLPQTHEVCSSTFYSLYLYLVGSAVGIALDFMPTVDFDTEPPPETFLGSRWLIQWWGMLEPFFAKMPTDLIMSANDIASLVLYVNRARTWGSQTARSFGDIGNSALPNYFLDVANTAISMMILDAVLFPIIQAFTLRRKHSPRCASCCSINCCASCSCFNCCCCYGITLKEALSVATLVQTPQGEIIGSRTVCDKTTRTAARDSEPPLDGNPDGSAPSDVPQGFTATEPQGSVVFCHGGASASSPPAHGL